MTFPQAHHLTTHERTHRAGARNGRQGREIAEEKPRLVFLDAGIVSTFDEETYAHVVDVFEAMLTRQGTRAAECLIYL
jgi:hypothetical protein